MDFLVVGAVNNLPGWQGWVLGPAGGFLVIEAINILLKHGGGAWCLPRGERGSQCLPLEPKMAVVTCAHPWSSYR